MTRAIKYGLIVIAILIGEINISLCQNNLIVHIDNTTPCLKVRTELVNWTGLNPNIYFDFKFNKHIGINAGILYRFTGFIWSAPKIMLRENIHEWLNIRGFGYDLGVKYYSKPTKFYLLSCRLDILNLNKRLYWSERVEDQEWGKINYSDLHLRLLRGIEYYNKKRFYKEIYFGIGLLIAKKEFDLESPTDDPFETIQNKGIDHYVIPTVHFAFNLGWRLNIPRPK